MKIFVMVDMEGISGVCRKSQVLADGAHYQSARKYLTWDVNACVDGSFAGGAAEVVVCDAHSSGYNFLWEELDPRAQYVQGDSPEERIPGIASCDGLILLGYHAMAGTRRAVLEHTMSSVEWQNFWINGVKCGEIAIDAAVAGHHDVPTIMTSGDDKACREARRFIKGVVTAEVKKGLDVQGAVLLPKDRARDLIARAAARAVRKCAQIKPFKVKSPVTMRLELVSRGRLPLSRPYVKVIDGRTFEVTAPTVEEALRLLS
ncbi:MAG: M55 family metallopeptidase [Planctomycetota bacterium]